MHSEELLLSSADYGILGSTLLVSSAIGVYFQFRNDDQGGADEYLLAGKNMPLLPVAFSLMATFMSSTTFVGIPAEMYLYGTHMAFMNVGFVLGPVVAAYLFLPVFFENNVTTSYEYLEKRFGKTTRKLVSAVSALTMILYTSAVLFAPALALNAVTNLSVWFSVVAIGVVCTFYSSIGGMKAVLWADLFQSLLMYVSLGAIIVIGCNNLGGISNVFTAAYEGRRLTIPSFTMDLAIHYTIYSVIAQSLMISVASYGTNQIQVQRMLTLQNITRSKLATFFSIPMIVLFQLMCCMCGLITYAYFQSCDPLSAPNRPIVSPDQILPYLITSMMRDMPGLPGLCISGVFSASLSTVSSSINSLAAVTVQDFLPGLRKTIFVTKAVSLFYGALCIGTAFLISSLGTLVKLTILITGLINGPVLGVFLLGTCSRTANEQGALSAVVVSFGVAAFLTFKPSYRTDPVLPLSTDCPGLTQNDSESFTTLLSSSSIRKTYLATTYAPPIHPVTDADCTKSKLTVPDCGLTTPEEYETQNTFSLAYMWISTVALITALIVGILVSLIVSCIRKKSSDTPDRYLNPARLWFAKRKLYNVEDDTKTADDTTVSKDGKQTSHL